MKSLFYLLIGVPIFILIGCSPSEDQDLEYELFHSEKMLQSIAVEIPYKAKFVTVQAEDAFNEMCLFNSPSDFWVLDHQLGSGNATHIGNFTTDLRFCFHVVLDENGAPYFEGGFGEFNGATSVIEANNGDKLYTEGTGSKIKPSQKEGYLFEFEHLINITGGTGRFENATGEIINYGNVRADGTGTEHVQEGTIILNK